ncbi:glucan endo-1,3-beta-glucosidase [Selaginella moellendorffii]|uniref:glucan endo-1,3-beta-glucosidase n=1 Tax=Selaginella moellendorffii TaxID=88036 RepID=UPI000D1C8967|nr:glucan endo-1,3-beta-glucosidase [Selaginella moellendorffii]|eukprot:XP_024545538.1 glucan endo-1,3-beta-glucosidase [Selaginella moellendorffii]
MASARVLICTTLQILLLASSAFLDSAAIGVNLGFSGNNLPPISRTVELIKSLPINIDRVKIFEANVDVIRAFAGSNLKMLVSVTNDEISNIASSSQAAANWVNDHIAPVASSTNIEFVAVGNEVLSPSRNDLVPAMRNIRSALDASNFRNIKVTTPLALNFLADGSFPPSKGSFRGDYSSILGSLLDFLSSTDSPFMVNVYPYFSWKNDQSIQLSYALFQSRQTVVSDGQYNYNNLLDATVDTVYAAMEKSGHGNVKIAIGESGWPSSGGDGATTENAQAYLSGLINKINSGNGTPRISGPLIANIFALYDENQKGGEEIERHFGLLRPDGTPKYSLP